MIYYSLEKLAKRKSDPNISYDLNDLVYLPGDWRGPRGSLSAAERARNARLLNIALRRPWTIKQKSLQGNFYLLEQRDIQDPETGLYYSWTIGNLGFGGTHHNLPTTQDLRRGFREYVARADAREREEREEKQREQLQEFSRKSPNLEAWSKLNCETVEDCQKIIGDIFNFLETRREYIPIQAKLYKKFTGTLLRWDTVSYSQLYKDCKTVEDYQKIIRDIFEFIGRHYPPIRKRLYKSLEGRMRFRMKKKKRPRKKSRHTTKIKSRKPAKKKSRKPAKKKSRKPAKKKSRKPAKKKSRKPAKKKSRKPAKKKSRKPAKKKSRKPAKKKSDLTKLSVKNLKLKLKLLKLPVSGKKSVLIERLLLSGRYNPDNDDILTAVLSGKSQSVPGKRKAKRKTKFKMWVGEHDHSGLNSLQDGENLIGVEVPSTAVRKGDIIEHGKALSNGLGKTSYHFVLSTTTYTPRLVDRRISGEIEKAINDKKLIHIQTYVKPGTKAYVTVERDRSGRVTQIFDESYITTVDGTRQIGWGISKTEILQFLTTDLLNLVKNGAMRLPHAINIMQELNIKTRAWIEDKFNIVKSGGPILSFPDVIINALNDLKRDIRETEEGSTQAMNRRAEDEKVLAGIFKTQINVFDLREDGDTIQEFVRIGEGGEMTGTVNVLRRGENYNELVPKSHYQEE